jgi:hypothetical protein
MRDVGPFSIGVQRERLGRISADGVSCARSDRVLLTGLISSPSNGDIHHARAPPRGCWQLRTKPPGPAIAQPTDPVSRMLNHDDKLEGWFIGNLEPVSRTSQVYKLGGEKSSRCPHVTGPGRPMSALCMYQPKLLEAVMRRTFVRTNM